MEISSESAEHGWRIRPAHESDYRAVRIILPDVVHFGSGYAGLVAESTADETVVAALVLSPRLRFDPASGARIALHVIQSWRRRGIGAALIDAAATQLKDSPVAALYAWRPIARESAEAMAWRTLRFDRETSTEITRAELARGIELLTPLYEGIVERRWIPPDAKLMPLRHANFAQIAALHAKYLGGAERDIRNRLRSEGAGRVALDVSPVLTIGGEIMAFTLVRIVPDKTCYVEATVVHPSLRGGWANLWLKYEGMCWARDAGAATMVFQTYERHSDTRKLARQMGGSTTELIEPYRLFKPTAADASGVSVPSDAE